MCNSYCESVSHALFRCSRAKEVWEGLGMGAKIDNAAVLEVVTAPILETLLLDTAEVTSLPEVRTCDITAIASW